MKNLYEVSHIKKLLSKYNFKFLKKLGQNFLTDVNVCPLMAKESLKEYKDVGVIEIGPGIGVLTCELAKRAKKVVSVEIDKRLLPILNETLSEFKNVKIVNDDILKVDLKKLINDEFSGMQVVVCANLPYFITSQTIMRLLEERLPLKSITVMVQKEVANRVCAAPGTKLCGAISAAVSYYCKPKILFEVSKKSFIPQPKVDSAVIHLEILNESRVAVKNEKLFFDIIKAGFSKRRKTIKNSLSAGFISKKSDITAMLNACNIDPNLRAEQLYLNNFADICNWIFELNKK